MQPQVVDPRTSLALWLRAGRASKRLSLDEVARITKIQSRILEKLESGNHEGLPAEVFVRGFVRSFARCVGLDENEATERLVECAGIAQPAPAPPPTVVMIAPEPTPVSEPAAAAAIEVEAAPVVEVAETPKKKRGRKRPAGTTPPRSQRRKKKATEPQAVDAAAIVVAATTVEAPPPIVVEPEIVPAEQIFAEGSDRFDATASDPPEVAVDSTEIWRPTMPPLASTPSVPWRRPSLPTSTSAVPVTPSLVIDDADPERAEREQNERTARASRDQRVSFLPPILLDRDDRSQRQGGLTLAVIILLIAATLTLSYLMRRPTVSGDGVTMIDSQTTLAKI
jgi:hypothetical protein